MTPSVDALGAEWSHARYYATPKGRAARAWSGMKYRSGRPGTYAHVELRMTRAEFVAWAVPEYERWIAENPGAQPSIDRIDPRGHYELANIRIIDQRLNSALAVKQNTNPRRADGSLIWPAKGLARCGQCKQMLPLSAFTARTVVRYRISRCLACRRVRRSELSDGGSTPATRRYARGVAAGLVRAAQVVATYFRDAESDVARLNGAVLAAELQRLAKEVKP